MKQIPLTELGLLTRIMGMTFSDQDGECLAAIRKANNILKKYDLRWADVFGRTVNVPDNGSYNPPPKSGMTPPGGDVEEAGPEMTIYAQCRRALDELRGNVTPSFQNFLDSLDKQLSRTKYLSQDQRRPLFVAVARYRAQRKRDA